MKQEQEKVDELKKEALKVFHKMLQVKEIEKSASAAELEATIRSNMDLKKMWERVSEMERFENKRSVDDMVVD